MRFVRPFASILVDALFVLAVLVAVALRRDPTPIVAVWIVSTLAVLKLYAIRAGCAFRKGPLR